MQLALGVREPEPTMPIWFRADAGGGSVLPAAILLPEHARLLDAGCWTWGAVAEGGGVGDAGDAVGEGADEAVVVLDGVGAAGIDPEEGVAAPVVLSWPARSPKKALR
jgi:hypothetical protein